MSSDKDTNARTIFFLGAHTHAHQHFLALTGDQEEVAGEEGLALSLIMQLL